MAHVITDEELLNLEGAEGETASHRRRMAAAAKTDGHGEEDSDRDESLFIL